MTRNHAIDTIDLEFFEVMNKIGDALREHGDLESVERVVQAIILYMKSRRVGGLNDTG
jgi:hypothetical protein